MFLKRNAIALACCVILHFSSVKAETSNGKSTSKEDLEENDDSILNDDHTFVALIELGKKKSENVKKTKPAGGNKNKNKTKKRRKELSSEEESTNDDEPDLVSTDEEDSENDDAECPVCNNTYSQDKKGEKWIRCIQCFQWMHEDCVENPGPKFVCSICLEN